MKGKGAPRLVRLWRIPRGMAQAPALSAFGLRRLDAALPQQACLRRDGEDRHHNNDGGNPKNIPRPSGTPFKGGHKTTFPHILESFGEGPPSKGVACGGAPPA